MGRIDNRISFLAVYRLYHLINIIKGYIKNKTAVSHVSLHSPLQYHLNLPGSAAGTM